MRSLITLLALLLAEGSGFAATFGDQNAYSGTLIVRDNLHAFQASPSESGICDSVTAHVRFVFDSCKMRCALYTIVDLDTVLVANGVTEERRFGIAAYSWQGFAFADPKPEVSAGSPYFIALFGDSAGQGGNGSPRGGTLSGGGVMVNRTADYESGCPSALNPVTGSSSAKLSIYVTYTPTSASTQSPRRRRIVGSRLYSTP